MNDCNNNEEFILNVLKESLRTSEGDIEYDSDNIVELFCDNSDPGPSTSRGRYVGLTSTPK